MGLHDPARPAPRASDALRERMTLRCTYCHDDLARDDAAFCATCLAPHHGACQRLHGRCAAPGCDERAVVRPRTSGRRLRRQPEPERARRAVAGDGAASLARSSLMALGVVTLGVLALEGRAALMASRREAAAPTPTPTVIVVNERPAESPARTSEPTPSPTPTPLANARLQLTADGFTFPLLLAPAERLVVLRAANDLHVARLAPDGSAQAVFVALGRVDVRLPAGHDAVSLDGAEPITVDVDAAAPDQQLLRRRRATADEVRRALETSR